MVLMVLPVSAESGGSVEIGTSLGMTFESDGNLSLSIGVPSGAFLGLGSMYMTVFASQNWMIEPQVLLNYNTSADEALFSGMLQLGYLVDPEAGSSPYLTVHGGYFHLGNDLSSPAFGIGMGIRNKIVGGAAAIRGEARFRDYTDRAFDLRELSLLVALGVVL
jgi:hypothetical protein